MFREPHAEIYIQKAIKEQQIPSLLSLKMELIYLAASLLPLNIFIP